MKILLLDVETSPNTAHVWGLFKQNISISQIMDTSYVMCWSAKWLGDEEIFFDSVHKSKPKKMLKGIHALLEEADAVIHYNGQRFDVPVLNKEFLLNGFTPPSTYKQIDLLLTARSRFRFPSNKLDFIAQALGVGKKHSHAGHELWVKCMAGDDEAWKVMEEYNKQDVNLLEKVYSIFLPWIKNHPNLGLFKGADVCPNCGGKHLQRRGKAYTAASSYQRFRCRDCGTWSRSRLADKETRPTIVSDRT
jgi:DNA polymerase elongation subunit (family B)